MEKKLGQRTENKEERKKAFESARQMIEKQFGKGAIIQLGGSNAIEQGIQCIPTGALVLDRALGVGGYPRGRIIEIYGPESSGKTTLSLHAIAEAQKLGGTAAFIDAEHALDPAYAKNLGVDITNLWVSQPDNGEQALEITEQLIRSGAIDIIVIDSVAALTPKAEIAGLMGESIVGAQARLMSQALRKLTGIIHKTSCCLIFINQIRMKIGVIYGSPETTSGGNALKFYASLRLDIRRVDRISAGTDNYIGNKVKVKVAKNKVAPPFKVVDFSIYYGKGISREENILELSVEYNHIQKTGSWYSMGEERLGQGRENVIQYLTEHPDIANDLEKKVTAQFLTKPNAAEGASKTAEGASKTAEEGSKTAEEGSKTEQKASKSEQKASKTEQAASKTATGSTPASASSSTAEASAAKSTESATSKTAAAPSTETGTETETSTETAAATKASAESETAKKVPHTNEALEKP